MMEILQDLPRVEMNRLEKEQMIPSSPQRLGKRNQALRGIILHVLLQSHALFSLAAKLNRRLARALREIS